MKALLSSVALVAIPLSGLMAPPASAQLAVYDPANHAQNILQAVRALQEIDNQVRQLTHEIDMIEKMARDLETLPVEVARAIIADRIRRIGELMRDAEGIGYGVEEVEEEYENLYPETYGDTPPQSDVLVEDARADIAADIAGASRAMPTSTRSSWSLRPCATMPRIPRH